MTVLTVLMCFASTSAIAQLKEVRGVQTRKVTYSEYVGYSTISRDGFEFKNENDYAVWVEAELWNAEYVWSIDEWDRVTTLKEGVRDTKSFTLQAGETYVWKCHDKMQDKDYHNNKPNYYIVYKAYKAE